MKADLPVWLERLLGVDPAEAGEGTVWSLDHSWPWAPWLSLVGLVLAACAILFCYLREGRTVGRWYALALASLRSLAVLVVLFMIAEVVLSGQRTGLPYVAVLLDDSASMGIVDRYDDENQRQRVEKRVRSAGLDEPSRLNQAKALLLERKGELLAEIEKRYKLKVYFVSGAARAQSGSVPELLTQIEGLEPAGESSRLGLAVRSVLDDLRGTPPSAIVLLSDGINTDGETLLDAADYARRKSVPLFAVALGSVDPIRNLKLHDLLVDDVVFVDDVVNFEFKLTASGLDGQTAKVVLRKKDDPTPLASIEVRVGPDNQPQDVRLPYRPAEVGEFQYVVEVQNLPQEDQADDNREERAVSVRKEQVKVLLVQSVPNFEYKYLKHLLERDSTIELKTVLQDADLEYAEIDRSALPVFPVRREELFEYDVLLFGDVNPAYLSSAVMQNIADFVSEQGRGVVFMAGPLHNPASYRNTPLAGLLPIDLAAVSSPETGQALTQSFTVEPTELGWSSPHMQLGDSPDDTRRTWRDLPGLYWFFEAPVLKPAARVLAEHSSRLTDDGGKLPLFVLQYVGKGKVLFHATDETWRWRFRVGDVLFARYWVQTIRYLSRSKLLGQDRAAELTADKREFRRGEAVRLRVQFFDERLAPADDDGVTVVLERPGHKNRQVRLVRSPTSRGTFEGVFSGAGEGKYHAWVAAPTLKGGAPATDFTVIAPPGEFQRVQLDMAELQAAAAASKGEVYTLATAHKLIDKLPEGRQVPIESLEPIVLWNKWPLVLVFVGLLATEWVLRKRKGLL